ncbi:unnamed protein product [Cochlearia groenlandica]
MRMRSGEDEEGEAIVAMGSLFKLTQVYLWDDGSTTDLVPLFHEQIDNICDDMGLVKEMKDLGLPVSFQTNKEWKNRTRGLQKKGIKNRSNEVNYLFEEEEKDVVALAQDIVTDIGDEEVVRPILENDCVLRTDVEEEEEEEEEESNETVRICCLGSEDKDSVLMSEKIDSQSCKFGENNESDEWKVCWDSFYGQSFFYNMTTQESTWQPPLGMEHLAYSSESHNLNELSIESTEKPHDDLLRTGSANDVPAEKSDDLGGVCQGQCETEVVEEVSSLINTYQETSIGNQSLDTTTLEDGGNAAHVVPSTRKAKKKSRRNRTKKIFSNTAGTQKKGVLEEYSEILGKYWCQRYLLFSRFDEGVKLDEEGWFSVTPETIAKHHATRCNGGIVIDCFSGVGGNAIQFASRSHYVVAVDLDPKKLELAHHNATIYGVADNIDFVNGDFFDLAQNLKGGTVFLSPPWGGPDYVKASTYDMKTMLRPRDGDALFKAAMNIAPTIIMFLPRNVDINQLAELALSTSPPWSLEAKKNYLNGKLKAITAYYVRQDCC